MGLDISQTEFSDDAHARFRQRLDQNLELLAQLLRRPGFGEGVATFGAELELYIVNCQGRPVPCNTEIRDQLDDPQLTLELNRYNLEYNLSPERVAGRPFTAMEAQIVDALERVNDVAQAYAAQVIPIGILPTLKRRDFGPRNMTDLCRYHCLTRQLARLRGALFCVHINGEEPVFLRSRDLTLEGANTSLQLHYRVTPRAFAQTYNAVQLATPIALAIGVNSPFMLGRRLWHETRIPLFKHAIDGQTRDQHHAHLPSRVDFGTGWVREGAWELFAENVYLHPPLLPICSEEDAEQGEPPKLFELLLHQGTIWPWNRAIYDAADGGHLRIEMRALPAGPSACDMMANAAFLIGLAEGLAPEMPRWMASLPYRTLVYNFYRAAQYGLEAKLLWPVAGGGGLEHCGVVDLAQSLLPLAHQGLERIGVAREERERYLGLIEARLAARRTGADWQLQQFARLSKSEKRHIALSHLMRQYIEYSRQNLPVATWKDL